MTAQPAELTKVLEDFSAKIGKDLAAEREASIERGRKLEEQIAALKTSGTDEKAKDAYQRAMANKTPMTMNAGEQPADFIERLKARSAVEHVQVPGVGRMAIVRSIPRGLQSVKDTRGLHVVRMLRAQALAVAKGELADDVDAVLDIAARTWGAHDESVQHIEHVRDMNRAYNKADEGQRSEMERALGTVALGSGAALAGQPDQWATFFDYLFPRSALSRLGMASVPMKNGMLFNFFDSAASASFVEEGTGPNESSPSDGQMVIIRRLMAGILAVNNELLEESSYAVDALLRQHLGKSMLALRDLKLIQGRGTNNEVHGLDYWVEQPTTAHYFNRTLDSGAATYKTIRSNLLKCLELISEENIGVEPSEGGNPGFVFTNGVKYGLMRVVVGTQEREPFNDEMKGGTIMGVPYSSSSQTTKTLAGDGAGHGTNNKSRVYLVDFNNFVAAEDEVPSIEVVRGGAYKDASGNVVSGLTNRQTVIAAHQRTEGVDVYRGKSIARIDSVDWQAAFA